MKVVLFDVKTKKKKQMVLDGNSKKYVRLEIGPNVVYGFKSVSKSVTLLNYTDKEWLREDVIRMEVIK